MNTAACTVSGSLTLRPMYSENVHSAIPNMIATTTMPNAGEHARLEPEPDDQRGDHEHQTWNASRTLSLTVRPSEEGGAGDRQ